tara:strand:+ start:1909 stop:3195 length:1287 start_codon:yes stop_codon:yes gene_type:complete
MNKLKVLLEAPILTQSGYGVHSRLVFEALKDHPALEIHIFPLQWGSTSWIPDVDPQIEDGIRKYHEYAALCKNNNTERVYDIQIHVGIPNEFDKKARYSVMVTAGIETDRVSWPWILKTHEGIDRVIVPSKHSKEVYSGTMYEATNNQDNTKTNIGCNCPVEVVPYPVRQVEPADTGFNFATDFNFLNVGLLGPRKNIEHCIKWFLKEFKDDSSVGLILKTGVAKGTLVDREATLRLIKNVVDKTPERQCKIYLLHGNMSEEELHSLYVHPKIKALVTTTHGEGYGLPIFEAAYSQMPVVATDWSAHLDFLEGTIKKNGKEKSKKLFAKVDYKMKEIDKSVVWGDILVEGARWAYPEEISFRKQIRAVYKNYGMYKKWARILQEQILESHALDKVLDKMSTEILAGLPVELLSRLTQEEPETEVVVFE